MMMTTTKTKRLIGAHVSAAGGVDKAIARAHDIGSNCAQVFSGSPRVWKKPAMDSIDTKKLFSEQQKYGVKPIFTHALYLVNLASDKAELRAKSESVLEFDLKFDALVKGSGVVVHIGSHQGRGWEAVKGQIATSIKKILKSTPEESTFLIENAAGQKGKIGGQLEEVKWLIDQINSPRLGWCFDTCHAWAGGYGLGKHKSGETGSTQKNAIKEITRLGLWRELKLIHLNDSRDDFNSGRDRHANLGEGNIPQADLRYFLNHDKVKDIPIILEVPGFDGKGPDAKNIELTKKITQT